MKMILLVPIIRLSTDSNRIGISLTKDEIDFLHTKITQFRHILKLCRERGLSTLLTTHSDVFDNVGVYYKWKIINVHKQPDKIIK
jgi:hypothetical protein